MFARLNLSRINSIGTLTIYLVVFIGIVLKAVFIPITHDEMSTALDYGFYSYWDITQYPYSTPNNHILNTILSKLSIDLLGNEPWTIRLPNMLAFCVYAFAAYRILSLVLTKHSRFFIPGALLFVCSPYFLDFFSLCRGYGLASAFCLLSISYLISGYKSTIQGHILFAVLFAVIASYANFTVLIFWVGITIMAGLYFIINYEFKKTIVALMGIALITLLYLLLIYTPLEKMYSNNEFIYWSSNGFIEDTIKILVDQSLYNSSMFPSYESMIKAIDVVTYSILALTLINVIYLIWSGIHTKQWREWVSTPIFIATFLLCLTVAINLFQCYWMGTPNLRGRTALFLFPLFISTLITSRKVFDKLRLNWVKWLISGVVTGGIIYHLSDTYSKNYFREWWFDQNTYDVLNYIEEHHVDEDVILYSHWLFYPSFRYHTETNPNNWLIFAGYNKSIDTNGYADYYFTLSEDSIYLKVLYNPVLKIDNRWLFKHK